MLKLYLGWQRKKGLGCTDPHRSTHLPQDFQGHTFSIVTMEYAPFSCYDKLPDGGVSLHDCVDTRMLNAMASLLNFTYTVREPEDGHWGYKLEDGNYTGVDYFLKGLGSLGQLDI